MSEAPDKPDLETITEEETQELPPLNVARCMGYIGPKGVVEPHPYLSDTPVHEGSTGVCDECYKMYGIPKNTEARPQ